MRPADVRIRKVLATNGQPTVEVEVETSRGTVRSAAPMGTSRGRYEAFQTTAEEAMSKFRVIKRAFTARDFSGQKELDKAIREIDGSTHFRDMGGNLAIAISSAFLKAFALEQKVEVWEYMAKEYGSSPAIPSPICNVVGGWKGQSDFQEFLFLPVHQKSFEDSLFKINEAYGDVRRALEKEDKHFKSSKNLESAWVTSLGYDRILEIMKRIADERMLKVGVDVAASQIFRQGFYHYRGGVKMNPHDHFAFLEGIVRKFPVSYIEDPFQEDDWLSFSTATHRWQPRMVCGDDFYATRIHRLLSGVDKKATNAAIVKPNQVGTITETAEFAAEAQRRGLITVLSHRSGETDDNIISHIAVGLGCDYVKFGMAGERVVKLNEMLRIEDRIESSLDVQYSKLSALSHSLMERLSE